ncbi:phage major capsid protein, P2 family [Arsenophonus sp. aPb]|uniref:phage major capsid protein, P2 family n=1 Tax=Arsenophonus sp. aPb TaxID=3041619 RepID=UPI0024691130|nr:phage major capsid protein, P2 family [Arsenophonus sp. aPb]WGL97180.1 phage major capsid protein, P2 family [Arsenophonus sp. aPb]
MRKETRIQFNAYLTRLGELYGVAPMEFATTKVDIEPAKAQRLESKIQESAAFLKKINMVPVKAQTGEKIGLGIGTTIASTTDTTAKEREPIDPTQLSQQEYHCYQTNFDTAIRYAKLDAWAIFNDFQRRIRDAIIRRQALDRIMIGWNGVKREKTSDRTKYPKLDDVNVGWLQKMRLEAPDHVLGSTTDKATGKTTAQPIKVGPGGDYENLDALVMQAVDEGIAEVYQDDTELVVICGRKLLADKYFPIVNQAQPNTEMLAADMIISQKRLGGLPAVRVPSFPQNAMLVTRLDNLSIYWQIDSRRRQVKDKPERDRIENYESVNEDYLVEDYDCAALVENIELVKARPEPKPDPNPGEKQAIIPEETQTPPVNEG